MYKKNPDICISLNEKESRYRGSSVLSVLLNFLFVEIFDQEFPVVLNDFFSSLRTSQTLRLCVGQHSPFSHFNQGTCTAMFNDEEAQSCLFGSFFIVERILFVFNAVDI